jgi:hypothetical protein
MSGARKLRALCSKCRTFVLGQPARSRWCEPVTAHPTHPARLDAALTEYIAGHWCNHLERCGILWHVRNRDEFTVGESS